RRLSVGGRGRPQTYPFAARCSIANRACFRTWLRLPPAHAAMVRTRWCTSGAHRRNVVLARTHRLHCCTHGHFDSAAHGAQYVSASQTQHPLATRGTQSRADRADLAQRGALAKNFSISGSADRGSTHSKKILRAPTVKLSDYKRPLPDVFAARRRPRETFLACALRKPGSRPRPQAPACWMKPEPGPRCHLQ